MSDKRPECPKCGKVMIKGSKTSTGRIRWTCRDQTVKGKGNYCYSTTDPSRKPEARQRSGKRFDAPEGDRTFRRKLREDAKVYIITAAQNATPVHEVFWECLQTAAKHRGAELIVVPLRYKNPTSTWTASQANEERWDVKVLPYLWNVRKVLNENLVLLADIKVQPTAVEPLTGFDAISGSSSAILGHTKMQLKSIATPSNKMAKILTTTGACTVENYTDSRAGALGKFHHSLSALIVEVKGRKFFIRQLHFDRKTESFTDLDTRYYVSRVTKAPRPEALVLGDLHVDAIDPSVERATFGPGGIVPTLKPKHLVFHDTLDSYAVNPHHNGNPFNAIAKMQAGRSSIEEEVRRACIFVRERTTGDIVSVIVPSNHDDMLARWIVAHDWRQNPVNASFYLRAALEMVKGTRMTEIGTVYPSPFPMIFPSMVKSMEGIRLLKPDESFTLAGVELSMHGDRGPGGARGSIKNLRRIGIKSIIGHSHRPGIEEGTVQVGTSTNLRLEYTVGSPSAWLNAHCVLHADGKRQLIVILSGHWRS